MQICIAMYINRGMHVNVFWCSISSLESLTTILKENVLQFSMFDKSIYVSVHSITPISCSSNFEEEEEWTLSFACPDYITCKE